MVRAAIGFLVLLAVSAPPAGASGPVPDRVAVEIAGAPDPDGRFEAAARDLIGASPAAPFDTQDLARALERLEGSGLFSAIQVPDPDWDARPLVLTFRLTPYARIRDIRLHNAFPMLEREVLGALGTAVGDAYRPSRSEASEAAVEKLYRDQGYIRPRATLTAAVDPADGRATLDLRVEKGDFYRIRTVSFDGNRALSAARLRVRMQTWQASLLPGSLSRYVASRLDEDVKRLRRFYRRKGYPEAEVTSEVVRLPEDRAADIRIGIVEGPRYEVLFEGNTAFWDMTLRKDLVLFTEGNPSDLGIRKSVRNLRERYRKDGFAAVDIQVITETHEDTRPPVRRVRFRIEEGPRDIVREVSFDGNRHIPEEALRDAMGTTPPRFPSEGVYSDEYLDADAQALRTLYLREGFPEVAIDRTVTRGEADAEGNRPVAVALSIEEGDRARVGEVRFEGLTVLDPAEAMEVLSLKTGGVYRAYMMTEDESVLANRISEKGYPHVTVEGRAEPDPGGEIHTVTYTVDEGPMVRMGEVHLFGNFRTRPGVIDAEMELAPGDPFSLSKMLESQRQIRNLNALESVRFSTPGLAEREDTVHLLAEVEERKPYYLQLGLGYDTDRRLNAAIKAGDRNLWGLNKDLWAGLEVSEIGYLAEANLTEPRFLGSRISATAGLAAEEREDFNQTFGVRSLSAGLTFQRRFGEHWTTALGFRYERREQFDNERVEEAPGDDEVFDPRSILVTTPSLIYNTTDSFVRPRSGVRVQAVTDLSRGLDNSLDDFVKYRLNASWYTTPLDRMTFAFRGRVGYIDPLSDDSTVPEDQLFFLGGLATVRGFQKNELRVDDDGDAVGGRTEILGNAEARIEVWDNVEWILFYDVGSIQNALGLGGDNGYRSSVGTGLRYLTPVGPIGISYGHKLDRDPGESPGAWHFSFGFAF